MRVFKAASVSRASAAIVALAACLVAVPAVAEEQKEQSADSTDASDGIIVTAQRREERLQDVPIAITAVTADSLDRSAITSIRDLHEVTPGLRISGHGAVVSPAIRGVRAEQNDPGNDANIALYIDGVYQPNQLGNSIQLADIDQIEVLKGPQGTLFGRNATGGAIRIFTRRPSLDTAQGQLDISYGNFDSIVASAFASVPLVEGKLAVSASANYSKRDGYNYDIVRNAYDRGAETQVYRAKILANPVDDLEIELFGSYLTYYDDSAVAWAPLDGSTVGRGQPGAVIPTRPRDYTSQDPTELTANVKTLGLRTSLDTGIGEFSSLSVFYRLEAFFVNDGDGTNANLINFPIHQRERNFQQELTFASRKFGKFQLTAGLNYYANMGKDDPVGFVGTSLAPAPDFKRYVYASQRTRAYGAFGELTFTPSDRLSFIAGLRYSNEERIARATGTTLAIEPDPIPFLGQKTFDGVTPRASVRYRFTDRDDTVYFTYSQGFKSGGFSISAMQVASFKPEKLASYEIGLKTSPSRAVSANISAYYYDYTDQQVASSCPPSAPMAQI